MWEVDIFGDRRKFIMLFGTVSVIDCDTQVRFACKASKSPVSEAQTPK